MEKSSKLIKDNDLVLKACIDFYKIPQKFSKCGILTLPYWFRNSLLCKECFGK